MDGGRAAGRDGEAAVVRGDLHTVLLGHGLGVVAGLLDVVQDQVKALQRVQVAERIGLVAGEALDAVRQCVNTGRSSDLARQVLDHAGVEDDVVGDHILVDDADLQLFLGHGDDGVGGDLCAGTGGCGDQNDGYALLGATRFVQQLLDAVLVGDQHTGQLGGIHNRAAAAGDDHIRTARLELVNELLHGHVAWLCRQVVEDIIVRAAGLDGFLGQGEQPRTLDALIGEHGNALDIVVLQNRGDVVHRVFAAIDGMGHFQTVSSKHSKNLPIYSLFYKLSVPVRRWGCTAPRSRAWHPEHPFR